MISPDSSAGTGEEPFLSSLDALIAAAPEDAPQLPAVVAPLGNLIPILQEGEQVTVNARDLHAFLEVGKVFGAWIQERIETFGFKQGEDFGVFSEIGNNPQGGRPIKDYHLTLDMAKELSMVERTPRGKQARQYFIECEKNLTKAGADPLAVLRDPAAMRDLLLGYAEKVIALEERVETLAPKAAGLDRIAGTAGTYCVTDAAKSLGVSPKRPFEYLESRQWIYRRSGEWIPMQSKQTAGLMACKVVSFQTSDGERSTTQARITTKGLARLAEVLTPAS